MAAEKHFEEKLKRWLESEGVYRLGTGEHEMKATPCGYWEKRHGSTYTGAGWPDMHIVVNGVSLEVELKAPRGKLSELQIQKLNQIDKSGCIGVVLYPDDFPKFQKLVSYIKQNLFIGVDIVTYSGFERRWNK